MTLQLVQEALINEEQKLVHENYNFSGVSDDALAMSLLFRWKCGG